MLIEGPTPTSMIDTNCTNCKRTITIDTSDEKNFIPNTNNPICRGCYEKEWSPQAIRDKKLNQIFELARSVNKKWWQFWK